MKLIFYKKVCKNFVYARSNCKEGKDFRVFLHKDQQSHQRISFWHDINYYNKSDKTYNMVIEIPKGELFKMEMSKETYNPIKQDTKRNKITNEEYLRFYKLTPEFNYGFLPQTWENDKLKHFDEGYVGDNDPLDLVELSNNRRYKIGEVINVFQVGSFCLIDQGEIDWKILVIDSNCITYEDSLKFLDKEENLKRLERIKNWFKIYKTLEGKKENIIYKDKIYNTQETHNIIEENHKYYTDLINCRI